MQNAHGKLTGDHCTLTYNFISLRRSLYRQIPYENGNLLSKSFASSFVYIHHSSFIIYHSLFITYHSSFTIHHLSFSFIDWRVSQSKVSQDIQLFILQSFLVFMRLHSSIDNQTYTSLINDKWLCSILFTFLPVGSFVGQSLGNSLLFSVGHKRLSPSVGPSICPSVGDDRVEKCANAHI